MNSIAKDMKNQLDTLSKLTPKKQLAFILDHKTPMRLVHALPASDLLLMIREVGAESSLELIELMRPSQVRALLDFEIWPGDRLDLKKAGWYFSLLFAADGDTAVAQIQGLDIELIGLMLKMVAHIYDTTVEDEPHDYPDLYSTSPDGRFIICFKDDDENFALKKALHALIEDSYGRDLPSILRTLEAIRFELPSGLEESSLRWREGRMADLGILSREERLKYFSPLKISELKNIFVSSDDSGDADSRDDQGQSASPIRSFAEAIDGKYPFLKSASLSASDRTRERFFLGLTHASINMFASLSGDFGDRDEMIGVAEYVRFLAELGVMQLSQGQLDRAAEVVESYSPAHAIRLGRTSLVGLRKRLTSKLSDHRFIFGQHFINADSPLKEMAKALCLPEPRYYEGLLDAKKLTVRFFSNISEVNATIAAVNELIARAEFIAYLKKSWPSANVNVDVKDRDGLSHSSMFARSLVNDFLKVPDPLAPIDGEQMKALFDDEQRLEQGFVDRAKEMAAYHAADFAKQASHQSEQARARAEHFLHAVLIQMEKNWQLLLG